MKEMWKAFKFVQHEGDDYDCQRIEITDGHYRGVVFSFSRIGYNVEEDRIEVGYNIHEDLGCETDCDEWHEIVYDIAQNIMLMKETITELNDKDIKETVEN